MSTSIIRQILESELTGITPRIDSTFENDDYVPIVDVPYQSIFFLFASPDNAYISRKYVQEGYMQVNLNYPELSGVAVVQARAELIRSKFKSGSIILSTVHITSTPEIGQGTNNAGRYVLPVFVKFRQYIQET